MASASIRSTTRARNGYIFLPPRSDQVWKMTVEDANGTVTDITDLISICEIEDFCTDSVGTFKFEIHDPYEIYASLWTGNEIFRYYKDYGTVATTGRFRGRLEKPSKRYHKLQCIGRREGARLLTTKVTLNYSNEEVSIIFKAMIAQFAPGFTSNNVATTPYFMTVDWVEKPFWECVKAMCDYTGYDAYDDFDLDFNFFEQGSRQNDIEGINHETNLIDITDFTPDYTQVRNRIKQYGATIDGVRLFYTAKVEGLTEEQYKTEILEDDNISTYDQLVETAEYELSVRKDPPLVGSTITYLLVELRPGDSPRIADDADRLVDGYYVSSGYKDTLDLEGGVFQTETHLFKETRKINHIIRDRILSENNKQDNAANPRGLQFSYAFPFDTDTGSHSGTAIDNGILYPIGATGTWTSPSRLTNSNVTSAYLVLNAEDINNISVRVSADGGVNYTTIGNGTYLTLSNPGQTLIIQVEFIAATARVQSLSLQYSY